MPYSDKTISYSILLIPDDKSYMIINISQLKSIVFLSLPLLTNIYLINRNMNLKVLDIDLENQLICILFTDYFLFLYKYPTSANNSLT